MPALPRAHVLLAGFAALTLIAPALPAQDSCGERADPAPGVLVSPEWLHRHRSDADLVLLQVERARAPYDSAHINGARFVAMGQFTVRKGDLLTEIPPLPQLDSLFESLGISNRSRIVLYGEILPVSRLFFTLEYLGLAGRVSVLNGGLAAWTAAQGQVSAEAPPPAARGSLELSPGPELFADLEWVRTHRADPNVVLMDARSRGEYDGTVLEEGVARAGHIPGAVSLDWTTTVSGGKFLGPAELRQLVVNAGAPEGKEVVTYCRVGTRASALYLVSRVLGYKVRLYDGSINEWAARADLPMAATPKP